MRASPKGVLHAGALAFTAFWLIATSAPDEAAGPCYEGLTSGATVELVLGERFAAPSIYVGPPSGADAGSDGFQSPPSCAAIDGLAPGSRLLLDVRHQQGRVHCSYYGTTRVEGTTGVTHEEGSTEGLAMSAPGTFASTKEDAAGCRGTWNLRVSHASSPELRGQRVNVLVAAADGLLVVERSMGIVQAQFCPEFEASGELWCADQFLIDSLTELP